MKHQIGLIGHPVSHSKSPELFREFFTTAPHQQWHYELWDLPNVDELYPIISNPNIRGFNVTLPHKTSIISQLNFISADAFQMQSVNTVISIPPHSKTLEQLRAHLENYNLDLIELDSLNAKQTSRSHFSQQKHSLQTDSINTNYLIGFNTDILGFEDSINRFHQKFNQAVIIGNGGSSKSVKQLLSIKKIPFLQYSRTPNSKDYVLGMEELSYRLPSPNTLWINTSPAGMSPNIDLMPMVPKTSIHTTDTLIDLIYNPEVTKLMRHFQQCGAQTLNGWTMLTSQAKHAWKLFQLSAELSKN